MAVKTKDSITVYHVMDIDSVTWYYKLQPSTAAAPAKPTTDPPPSGWFTAEPAYTEGSTNSLYIVEKTVYSDGTFTYSDVSLSSSYEAAKTAYNKSVAAQAAAANAQTVAANAARTATKYITDLTDGIFVAPEGQGPNDTQTPTGWKIKDALELLQTGVSYIWAGVSNGIAGVRIGKQDEGNVYLSGTGYVDVRNNNTVLAHFGYDEGISEDGTIQVAPYYNLGIRKVDTTIGNYSTAEGYNTEASNFCGHAEGYNTEASGTNSHAEGIYSKATGGSAHAEGRWSTASGNGSHAENGATAEGQDSHAEGSYSKASGNSAHAEGSATKASGKYSHSEGSQTLASGESAHAEGESCQSTGNYSHASGHGCFAVGESQTVIGKYNVTDSDNTYAFIIGNGTGLINRSNALTVEWSGTINTEGSLKAKSAIGTGGKLAWNDTAHAGVWLTTTGAIHLSESATSGGGIGFHYNFSASATTTLHEPASGILRCTGAFRVNGAVGVGGRTAYNDTTNTGTWITTSGEIHMAKDDNHGGYIGFHYNLSASATVSLSENSSGVITCSGGITVNGVFQFKDYTDSVRRPVSSAVTDGRRVGYLSAANTQYLTVVAQWGTTGTTYTEKTIPVASVKIQTIANIISVNSTNATIVAAEYISYGKVAQLFITWTNNNAISVPAYGNITNITVAFGLDILWDLSQPLLHQMKVLMR